MTSTASSKRGIGPVHLRAADAARRSRERSRSVPIVEPDDEYAQQADQPFAEGAATRSTRICATG